MVREEGFQHARTIINLRGSPSADPFRLRTTLQFYPHRRSVYVKNYLKFGEWPRRSALFLDTVLHADLPGRPEAMLDRVCAQGGVFRLWGHSSEIETFGGWEILYRFLRYAGARIPKQRHSNGTLVAELARSTARPWGSAAAASGARPEPVRRRT